MKYPVVEIFDSIQGEGFHIGTPVTFIRLAGCNLKCPWCDTDYEKYTEMTADEITFKIHYNKVVITGGEPTIHDLIPLLNALKDTPGHYIALETNGTNPTFEIRSLVDWITCSPKPQTDWKVNSECEFDELKYVVDGVFTPDKVSKEFGGKYFGKIWLQPESSQMEKRFQEAYEIAMKYPAFRVGIQLHKILKVR